MSRNSFLIEDILNKNNKTNTANDVSIHPFKKRSFAALNESYEQKAAKQFKSDSLLSPASSISYQSPDEPNQDYNDLIMSSMLHNYQSSDQLLNNYYAMLNQFQQQDRFQQSSDYNQQLSQFLMSRLLAQHQQQQMSRTMNKPVKILQQQQNEKLLQKPTSSISSSPGSSSNEYNSSSNNLSPQSSDDCSSSCIENVSPLDALLQLANSTFINKTNVGDLINSSLMDHEQITNSNFKKAFQNGFIDESVLLNNDLLLQQQHQQIEKHNKSSLNNSFDSTSTTTKPTPAILVTSSINSSSNNKRKRKNRTAFTANQIFELEKRFSNQRYLSPHDRDRIAYELSLSTAQVITWFQNRRAKQKRDIEEMKNDVVAAKNLKVLDPDLDVEKVLRCEKFKYDNDLSSKLSNSDNQDDYDNETDYDDDNQSVSGSNNGDSTADKSIISNENSNNK